MHRYFPRSIGNVKPSTLTPRGELGAALIRAWEGRESAIGYAEDIITGEHVAAANVTLTSTPYGQGWKFNGSSSVIGGNAAPMRDLTLNEFSAECLSHVIGAGDYVLWGYDNLPTTPREGFNFQYGTGGTGWGFEAYENGTGSFVSAAGAPTVGRPNHIVCVRRGTTVTFYINGLSVGTVTIGSGSMLLRNGVIGRFANSAVATAFLDGVVYYARLYNRALTPNEVMALNIDPYLPYKSNPTPFSYVQQNAIGSVWNSPIMRGIPARLL